MPAMPMTPAQIAAYCPACDPDFPDTAHVRPCHTRQAWELKPGDRIQLAHPLYVQPTICEVTRKQGPGPLSGRIQLDIDGRHTITVQGDQTFRLVSRAAG